jgi:chromate reductase, NAD(P)H dehydrogenase (quinone)
MPTSTPLLFLAGSARDASFNKKLARLAAKLAEDAGTPATFVDLSDYPMPIYDGDFEAKHGPPDNAHKLKSLIEAHAGVFIASPEYNAGVSPLLKNVLDWVSRIRAEDEAPLQVYRTRVFVLASASPGAFGGMRGLMMLRQILANGLSALVLPDQLVVPRAAAAFDESGMLVDDTQTEKLRDLVQELTRAAKVLRGEG